MALGVVTFESLTGAGEARHLDGDADSANTDGGRDAYAQRVPEDTVLCGAAVEGL